MEVLPLRLSVLFPQGKPGARGLPGPPGQLGAEVRCLCPLLFLSVFSRLSQQPAGSVQGGKPLLGPGLLQIHHQSFCSITAVPVTLL